MPTPITDFVLVRPDGTSTTNVTVCDYGSYIAYQC